MVVIALLLLVLVAAVVVFVVVTGSSGTATLEWDQLNLLFAPSPLVLFLLGAATMLLALAAIAMLRAGSRRSLAKRRELKRLRRLEGEQGRPIDRTSGPTQPVTAPHGTPRGGAPVVDVTDTRQHASTHPDVQVTGTQTRPVRSDGTDGTWNDPPRG